MGFFSRQFQSVIEWADEQDGVLMWKWQDNEIKKNSRLVIRPGQEAVFLYNGNIEGIFTEEGTSYIKSDIVPFLTTLRNFKFGFRTPMRAEVLFLNTSEQTVKWGTRNPVNIPAPGLPGGIPVRAFGTFVCRIADSDLFIAKVAGVKQVYTVENVKDRIMSVLDQLLMSHISREGKDMFNLQADAAVIAKGILADLDMDLRKIGLVATDFRIDSFSYPESIREMQEQAAGQTITGQGSGAIPSAGAAPKFCPKCGKPTGGTKFCENCGFQLQ